jgi:hypothetical protein
MGIQINGQTDTISASDGSLVVNGQQLTGVTDINASGIGTFGSGVVLTGGDITLGTGTTISSPASDTFAISTNGSERVRVDSSGKVGLGTNVISSKVNVLGTGNGSTGSTGLSDSSVASSLLLRASSNSSTSLALGTRDTGGQYIQGLYDANPVVSLRDIQINPYGGSVGIGTFADAFGGAPGNSTFVVGTSGVERARVDSSGRLLVGTPTARSNFYNTTAAAGFLLEGTGAQRRAAVVGADFAGALILALQKSGSAGGNTIVANGDGVGEITFQGNDGSEFVACAQIKVEIDGTPASNDMPGRIVLATTADGASSPTERMRIRSDGTTLIGKATGDDTVVGVKLGTNAGDNVFTVGSSASWALMCNRQSDDGTLILFRQANTDEGSISVSGTTVSYNGAHLSRWSQLPSGAERIEILRGSVLSNIDEMCEWIDPPTEAVLWEEGDELPEDVSVGDIKEPANPGGPQSNEQLNRMKVSDVEGDKNVSGVFQCWDDDDDTYTNDFYCAMTGDFIIRIAEGTTVERGDLLMSAGDGTAKPQGDGYVQDKTIAKVTSTHITCTYDDGSYCVPCVLMACRVVLLSKMHYLIAALLMVVAIIFPMLWVYVGLPYRRGPDYWWW